MAPVLLIIWVAPTLKPPLVATMLPVEAVNVVPETAPVDAILGAPVIAPVAENWVLPPTVNPVGTVKLDTVALDVHKLLWVAATDTTLGTPEMEPVLLMIWVAPTLKPPAVATMFPVDAVSDVPDTAPVDATLGTPVIAPRLLNWVTPPTVNPVGTTRLDTVALLLHKLLWVAAIDVILGAPVIAPTEEI